MQTASGDADGRWEMVDGRWETEMLLDGNEVDVDDDKPCPALALRVRESDMFPGRCWFRRRYTTENIV